MLDDLSGGGHIGTAADTSPAAGEELRELANRINDREKRSRKDQLEHARIQGEDLLRAKERCGHGLWLEWLKKNITSFGEWQAQAYMRFAKSVVTTDLAEDKQWEQWQSIQGNRQRDDGGAGEGAGGEPAKGIPLDTFAQIDDEGTAIRAWLVKRRERWPEWARPRFVAKVQNILELIAEDYPDGGGGEGEGQANTDPCGTEPV